MIAQSEPSKQPTISHKVAKGAIWLVAMQWLSRLIGLISTLIIARILLPDDFGLVALASSTIAILETLTFMNTNAAVVRHSDNGAAIYHTAWTISFIRGLIVAAFIVAASFIVPSMIDEPRLEPILWLLAIMPIITSLQSPMMAALDKELTFGPVFKLNLVAKLISVAITIIMAIIYKNYWAIIIGTMSAAILQMFFSYLAKPAMPKFCLSERAEIFSFTGWQSLNAVLSAINSRFDSFFIKAATNTDIVGHYYVGQQISQLPTSEIFYPLQRSLFAGLSQSYKKNKDISSISLDMVAFMAAGGLLLGCGFAFIAHDLVHIILGPKWAMVIPMIQIISPALGFQAASLAAQSIVNITYGPKAIFKYNLYFTPLRLSVFLYALFEYGFMGAIIAKATADIIQTLMMMHLTRDICGSILTILIRGFKMYAALSVMITVLYLLPPAVDMVTYSLAISLATKVGVGIIVYISSLWLLCRLFGNAGSLEDQIINRLRSVTN